MKLQRGLSVNGMKWRTKLAGVAAAALLLGMALTPAAFADTEPNGAIFMPEGPIFGGQDVQGAVGPGDEDDWYVFHVDGIRQLHLTSPQRPQPSGPGQGQGQGTTYPTCVSVELTDENGSPIPADFTSGPGESTFYVHVSQPEFQSCFSAVPYSFRVDPAGALVSGPGNPPVKGTAEPNDNRSLAGGPLMPGAWYHSALETVNDEDWLRFYVRPGVHRVDVQAVVYGPPCDFHEITLRTARGGELASSTDTRERVAHLTHRQRGPARLYVQIATGPVPSPSASCVRSQTVVRVRPDDAIMSAAQVKQACADGRTSTRRNRRLVAADNRAILRTAARGDATGGLVRKLRRDRRALRKSSAAVAAYCSR
jgi:hypothetical protein